MAFQGDSIYWVEVEKIVPNPFQPRREFDEQKLRELSDSVRMYGILQPLTVTRKEIQREDGTFYTEYELIAGERRLRASKLAGLAQVPVIIREGEESEQEKLELAIIENLQREDLNAVDRALAFRQLADVFGLSHVQVARKVGRSREYVSNSIRLLGLPDYMLTALKQAEISEGHARTLLMLNDKPEEQDVVFREILLKKISVRETESIVRKIAMEKVRKKTLPDFDTQLIEIEKRFMETLGTRVQIQKTEYGGRLTIDYFNVDDLEEMLKRMRSGERLSNISYTGATLTEAVPLTDFSVEASSDITQAESVDANIPPALNEPKDIHEYTQYQPELVEVAEVSHPAMVIRAESEENVAEIAGIPESLNREVPKSESVVSNLPYLEEALPPLVPPVTALEERPNFIPQAYVAPSAPVPVNLSVEVHTQSELVPVVDTNSHSEPIPSEPVAVTNRDFSPETPDRPSPVINQPKISWSNPIYQTPPPVMVPAMASNQIDKMDIPSLTPSQSQPELEKNPEPASDKDDSDLYSIRNFTI